MIWARRSIRLPTQDYAESGAYFITICTHEGKHVFGNVAEGRVYLSYEGRAVSRAWEWLEAQYDYVRLDEWVVMPNHLHGIIVITDGPLKRASPGSDYSENAPRTYGTTVLGGGSTTAGAQRRKPVGRLIGAFKTVSTKRINEWRHTPGGRLWQRNYYDRVVRSDVDMHRIRQYIADNPKHWRQNRG
jgi:REP element-mobilizing transposase RayT